MYAKKNQEQTSFDTLLGKSPYFFLFLLVFACGTQKKCHLQFILFCFLLILCPHQERKTDVFVYIQPDHEANHMGWT